VREDSRIWKEHYLSIALQQKLLRDHGEKIDWGIYLQGWQADYPVAVDSVLLRETTLTSIPFLALRKGQYNGLVAPPWIYFK
jgi:hypothetical protein